MASEEAALDFIVSLGQLGKFKEQTGRVVAGLEQIADAAEEAHAAAAPEGVSLMDKITGKLADKHPRTLKAISIGARGLAMAVEDLQTWVKESASAWKDHYLEMVAWRKEVGMDTSTMNEFSGALIGSTRQYTFALREALNINKVLATGARGARKEVMEMAAGLAEFEMMTGTSGEATAKLGKLLTQTFQTMTEDEFQRGLRATRETLRDSNIATGAFLDMLSSRRRIFSLWGRDNDQLMGGLTAWGKVLVDRGLELQEVDSIFGQLETSTSRLGKEFEIAMRSTDDNSEVMGIFVDRVRQLVKHYTEVKGFGREKIANILGVDPSALDALTASSEELGLAQQRWTEEYGMSLEDQRKRERERATGIERLKLLWQDMKNAGTDTVNSLTVVFEPFFNKMVDWVVTAGEAMIGWMRDMSDWVKKMADNLQTLAANADDVKGIVFGKEDKELGKTASQGRSTQFWQSMNPFQTDLQRALNIYKGYGNNFSMVPPKYQKILKENYPGLADNSIYAAKSKGQYTPPNQQVPQSAPKSSEDLRMEQLREAQRQSKALERLIEYEESKTRKTPGVPQKETTGGPRGGGVIGLDVRGN